MLRGILLWLLLRRLLLVLLRKVLRLLRLRLWTILRLLLLLRLRGILGLLLELLRGVLLGLLLVLFRGMLGLLRILGLAQLVADRGFFGSERGLVALNAHSGESMLSVLKRFILVLRCDPGE